MGIERPNAGEVKLDGVEVAGWPTHRIARHGRRHRVPALAAAAPADRAGEHQARAAAGQPAACCRRPRTWPTAREAIAERVGLGAVMHRLPRTLPFADLRRLELAKAIARNPQGGAGGRTLRRADLRRGRRLLRPDRQLPRRGPRRAAGRPQRQERRRAGRPRAGDVSRRAHRRRHRRGGDAQRDRAAGLSRRQDRNLRPARTRGQGPHAAAGGRAISACSTARRRRWRTSRSMSARASSSRSSA